MKQIGLLFLLLVAMMFAVYWMMQPQNAQKLATLNLGGVGGTRMVTETPQGKVIKVGSNSIPVELADTEQKRQIGLSNHTSLDQNSGMLFIFDQKNIKPDFWMKGMKFPIDIVWINDNKVTQINAEVPVAQENLSDNEIPRYSPSQPIDYVLELSAGAAKAKGIKVGDSVELPSL